MAENYITKNNKVRKGDVINVAGEAFDVVGTTAGGATIRAQKDGKEYTDVSYGWFEDVQAFFIKDTASIAYFEEVRAWEDAQDERY